MEEPLSAFDKLDDEFATWQVSRQEFEALVGEETGWDEAPYRRAKAHRYRPWGIDPVHNVTLDGQVSKNLPVRAVFPITSPPKPRVIKSPMRRFCMEGPDGGWRTTYAPTTPPAVKRALLKWRGPWKTRRSI